MAHFVFLVLLTAAEPAQSQNTPKAEPTQSKVRARREPEESHNTSNTEPDHTQNKTRTEPGQSQDTTKTKPKQSQNKTRTKPEAQATDYSIKLYSSQEKLAVLSKDLASCDELSENSRKAYSQRIDELIEMLEVPKII